MNGGSLGDILQKVRTGSVMHTQSAGGAGCLAGVGLGAVAGSAAPELIDPGAQEGRIPEDVLSAITAQVLQGLSYLHRHKHTVSAATSV